jgi:hypothetical protein
MGELVRHCSKCGSKLIDRAVVCVKCGHRVTSANFGTSQSVSSGTNSKETSRNIIIGIYGFSGAVGIFCALVPAIGAIILGICFNMIYAGLILLVVGVIYFLVQRGIFGWAFLFVGVLTTIFILFYRLGLLGDIAAYIQKIKTFSF